MADSLQRGTDRDVNAKIVEKARDSVSALFSNWEATWPASFSSWTNRALRLVVNQDVSGDPTGRERVHQSWLIVSQNDCIVAWLAPRTGSRDRDTIPAEKMSDVGADISAGLSEPKRYFVMMDAPSHAKRSWTVHPWLDMPATGEHFARAVEAFSEGRVTSVEAVYHRLGTDRVRCYLVTSGGDFVVYKDGVRNNELYVVNVNRIKDITVLADPMREVDQYVSRVIDQTIAFNG
jgi:hypothetical protein